MDVCGCPWRSMEVHVSIYSKWAFTCSRPCLCHSKHQLALHLAFLIWKHGAGLWGTSSHTQGCGLCSGFISKILRKSQKTGKFMTKLKILGSSNSMKWGSPELEFWAKSSGDVIFLIRWENSGLSIPSQESYKIHYTTNQAVSMDQGVTWSINNITTELGSILQFRRAPFHRIWGP